MNDYESRLAVAVEKLAALKHEIAFFKLQIKQEKKQAVWAKGSPIIRQFKAQWPDLTIDNGAGLTYLGLKFGVTDEYESHIPFGWECYETRTTGTGLGDPVLKIYRSRGVPALLYVTKAVR